ncbi:hypothetical protein AJ79_02586 [Helicocarpus griseus UAMH5409]|uniref:Uncharacterized protein n=1 Tax=Helicocarpus griseus UAMH5409 TaxID=1447875 RepID=A0A2B7Y2E6_9EURO|nr:hypothetical protein AJ79_02586 [Helicocarpus griseus UAMH5409]
MESQPPVYEERNEKRPPSFAQLRSQQQAPLLTPPASSFRTSFASVSLHMNDRVRLLGFSSTDVAQIHGILDQYWPKGVASTREYGASDEFRLNGSPWNPSTWFEDEKTAARRLMCGLLKGLYDLGWVLKAPVDVLKKDGNKDTLLFRLQQPPPPPCNWMCISFNKSDLLQLIGAPRAVCEAMSNILEDKIQRTQVLESSFEIKFLGYPWKAGGTDTVETRLILLKILDCLERFGFSLYGSLNQDTKQGEHVENTDTWFCNQQANWMPGIPIYHG